MGFLVVDLKSLECSSQTGTGNCGSHVPNPPQNHRDEQSKDFPHSPQTDLSIPVVREGIYPLKEGRSNIRQMVFYYNDHRSNGPCR